MLCEGQTIDETYRLVRQVGAGGMGTVFEATHARLAGRYAVKVLSGPMSRNADATVRFEREARVTSALQHPNVVQVVDHNHTADGVEYFVMEFLDGETLADRLNRAGRLAADEVIDVVQQIGAGLAAAHAHQIVHRDLKPENIQLVPVAGRARPLVKVFDFGISKVIEPGCDTRRPGAPIFGTPLYMAPEQIHRRGSGVGPAADQFALATLAHELLTGTNPFAGESVGAILSNVMYREPTSTGLGASVDAVLARAMAKEPLKRFPSVTDFADALSAAWRAETSILNHANTVETIPEETLRSSRPARRTSARRIGVGMLFGAAVVAASVAFAMEGRAPKRDGAGRLAGFASALPAATAGPREAPTPVAPPLPARLPSSLELGTPTSRPPAPAPSREATRPEPALATRRPPRSEDAGQRPFRDVVPPPASLHGGSARGTRPSPSHVATSSSHAPAPLADDPDATLPLDEGAF